MELWKELYKKEPRQGKFNGSRNKSSESSKLTAVLYTRAEQKVLEYLQKNVKKTEYQAVLEGVKEQRRMKQLARSWRCIAKEKPLAPSFRFIPCFNNTLGKRSLS